MRNGTKSGLKVNRFGWKYNSRKMKKRISKLEKEVKSLTSELDSSHRRSKHRHGSSSDKRPDWFGEPF